MTTNPLDLIDFKSIKNNTNLNYDNISNISYIFSKYLSLVYKDIVEQFDSVKTKGISKFSFKKYMKKLNFYISERIFFVFNKNGSGFITEDEFKEGMNRLYMSNAYDSIRFIYEILDPDDDGLISSANVALILKMLPLKKGSVSFEKLIEFYFCFEEKIDFSRFFKCVSYEKSDIFLNLIYYFYENKPFEKENLEVFGFEYKMKVDAYKIKDNHMDNEEEGNLKSNKSTVSSPNLKLVSPLKQSIRKNYEKERVDFNNDFLKLNSPQPRSKVNNSSNSNFSIKLNMINDENEDHTKQHSHYHINDSISFKSSSNLNSSLIENIRNSEYDDINKDYIITNSTSPLKHSDFIYKITEKGNLKKYFLSLIGKYIFYSKTASIRTVTDIEEMHYLENSYIKSHDQIQIDSVKLYGFSIIFPNKTRKYYTLSLNSQRDWVFSLKKSIEYRLFNDFYILKGCLGQGKYGKVKLGISKLDNKRVAVKIIKKEGLKMKEIERIYMEIDILKVCFHENIIKIYDFFENSDFIYIVIEYMKGGSLLSYVNHMENSIFEGEIRKISLKILNALSYIHSNGIIHRDIKLENILVSVKDKENHDENHDDEENDEDDKKEKTSLCKIKISDFGLSNIVKHKQMSKEKYGTLLYCSPEILNNSLHDKKTDVWSFGVCLYYIVTGSYPFINHSHEENNHDRIVRNILYNNPNFEHSRFKLYSNSLKEVIKQCLNKDLNQRPDVDLLLKDEFFRKTPKK